MSHPPGSPKNTFKKTFTSTTNSLSAIPKSPPERSREHSKFPPGARGSLPGHRRRPAEVLGPEAYSYPTTTCGATSPRSGTDSDLEAFSHNPADGSVAALPGQTAAKTNYLNQRFLSSRSLLVGEQSNAYRILLRYDREEPDIEGSKSNVAMNAWLPTSQFIPVVNFSVHL
ncbi:hypothetical protein PAAG_12689 [Paracoccidioides lutzii Pb01]|uniref:Uncharacterized protein n=1 Tax=Paracoccidioides lutzii (strain ATCC MYA-826 / Pb01) TaxID=502779 RepID=A0A0A2UYJ8_PARBA|nr:hypothetical protein PAAG_12689 [Paracoccidioides lutzii Pb01]KGQ00651.1 hypothetical protein PAAG_12689 [Paracoccidioides lutzii Pb01]